MTLDQITAEMQSLAPMLARYWELMEMKYAIESAARRAALSNVVKPGGKE